MYFLLFCTHSGDETLYDDADNDDDGAVIVMIIAAATTVTTTTTANAIMLHMLNVKTKVMQGMTGQIGAVSKLFRNCLNQHTWKVRHQVGTEHIVQKLLI
jgi:hypothetical protein